MDYNSQESHTGQLKSTAFWLVAARRDNVIIIVPRQLYLTSTFLIK